MRATTATAAFILLVCSTPCLAGVVTFDGGGGSSKWSNPNNWSTDAVPTHDDRAVIPTDFHVVIDDGNYTVDTIEIETNASLTIDPGFTLTLQDDDANLGGGGLLDPDPCTTLTGGDNSIVDGALIIAANNPPTDAGTLAIANCNHTFSGEGYIFGEDELSQITIATNRTLINQLATMGIAGGMTISRSATLRNEGLVEAEGVIVIETAIRDVAGADWAAGCKDTLVFETGYLGLNGDFWDHGLVWDPGCGMLQFEAPVSTCGTYRSTCGGVTLIGASTYFEYAFYQDLTSGGNCSNPGSGGPGGCNDPWIVTTDLTPCTCE